jgi:transcriptional regulator with XRE-family HTH domain
MPTNIGGRSSEQTLAGVLGSRLKELRLRRGLSQRALSQQLGLSKSTVAKYEGGVHAPSLAVLVRLATLLGVSVDSLLRRDRRDPRLARFLVEVELMEEGSRDLVFNLLELILEVYRILGERQTAAEIPR